MRASQVPWPIEAVGKATAIGERSGINQLREPYTAAALSGCLDAGGELRSLDHVADGTAGRCMTVRSGTQRFEGFPLDPFGGFVFVHACILSSAGGA